MCVVARISRLSTIHSDIIGQLNLESVLVDFCGDYANTCLPSITSLLYKALGQRVVLVAAKPLPDTRVNISVMSKVQQLLVVMKLDLQLHFKLTARGKLFTHVCLCKNRPRYDL